MWKVIWIEAGDSVIEAGANMSLLAISTAKITGQKGRVIAFRPRRLVFYVFTCNVALDDLIRLYAKNDCSKNKSVQKLRN